MEEIQEKELVSEPAVADNSETVSQKVEGQAQTAPSEQLILGKFKSVDELSKAYTELQKHQGIQSQELGSLRQNSVIFNNINKAWEELRLTQEAQQELTKVTEKYNTPEYFQDPSFRQIFKEAFLALGKNLDPDRLVNLIEGYVSSRIFAHEKSKAAKNETENVINSMTFSKNKTSEIAPPKKRLDEMTPKEVNELLQKLI